MICKTNAVIGGSVGGGGGSDNGESVKPTQPLEINVPDIIATGGAVYTFNIDNEYVLVSGNTTNCGLWLCNTITNTYEQLIKTSYSYQYFYKVKDKVVISSTNSSTGLYVYNHNTKKCEKKSSLGNSWSNAFTIEDTLLLNSNTATVVFDYEDEEFDELFYNDASIGYLTQMYQYGNKAVFKKNGNGSGFVFYNNTEKTLDWKIDSDNTGVYMYPTEHGLLVSYKDGATSIWYVGKLNEETDNFDSIQIGTGSHDISSSSNRVEHENGIIFWTGSSNSKGLYWLDYGTETLEKVFEDGYGFAKDHCKVLDKYIFLSQQTSGTSAIGCILFDTETKEIIRPLTTGSYYLCAKANDKLVLSHFNSNYKGLYVYDISTKELVTLSTTLYQQGNRSAKAYQFKDRVLAYFANGCYIINLVDNTYKTINGSPTPSADSVEFLETPSGSNLYLNAGGVARVYNYETNSVISISNTSGNAIYNKAYNVYKLEGENCYAYNKDKTKNPYTLYFDSEKKQWFIDKYYLGEI